MTLAICASALSVLSLLVARCVFHSALSRRVGALQISIIIIITISAPLTYPQEVRVYSAGPNSARVWFRGISMVTDEEGMVGYAVSGAC